MKWFSLCCLLLGTAGYGQQITYVQARLTGDFITVYYSLTGSVPGQTFSVDLYSSQDQYQQPLQRVRGDVGQGVTAGEIRQIEWGINQEFPGYQGTLAFQVRARCTFSPVTILFPQALTHLQKGQTYQLAWEGGVPDADVQLILLTEDNRQILIGAVPNAGSCEWTVPRTIPEGQAYRLRIKGKAPQGEYYSDSGRFSIRRKVPGYLREK